MRRSKTAAFGTVTRQGHDASDFYKRNIYAATKQKEKIEKRGLSKKLQLMETKNIETKIIETKNMETNIIYHGDSRNMKELPDNSIHLMITSPPYNVGKEYEEDLSLDEYRDLLKNVLRETYRVLVEGGRACMNIANIGRKPYIPLHAYVIQMASDCGFLMRGEIIWDKGASAGSSCAWGSWKSASNPVLRDVHEYILIFCKNTYSRLPTNQTATGKLVAKAAKNTIDREDFLENTKSVWRFSTASARKYKHAAPFPVELPARLIDLYSFAEDIVLDPFMGSGTTAEAAILKNRKYIGYEINEEYAKIANQRVKSVSLPLFK